MVRSFALVLLVGTIVVQCTNPAPPPPIGESKTATTRTLKASTPTQTPMGKGVATASPTATKTPEVSTTVTYLVRVSAIFWRSFSEFVYTKLMSFGKWPWTLGGVKVLNRGVPTRWGN
jgi:hypothetical protein